MGRRWFWSISLAAIVLMVLLAVPRTASAGGWSVVTLDGSGPTDVGPGTPVHIGFMVRQHGTRPIDGLTPKITLYNSETNETVTAVAKAEGAVGHYVATFTLPSAGTWEWTIDAFGPVAHMAPIDVRTAAQTQPATAAQSAPSAQPALWLWGSLAALVALAGAVAMVLPRVRRRRLSTQA